MITFVHIRYTLFAVIVFFILPQIRYSFPMKPPKVSFHAIHETKSISETGRSQTTLTNLSRDSRISRSAVGGDFLNTASTSISVDSARIVPDVFRNATAANKTADHIVHPQSLTRFGGLSFPNFRSPWVDRYLQRIAVIAGKLVNLLPRGTPPFRSLLRHEQGSEFASHSSSVANHKSSNRKSETREIFAPNSEARSRTLRLLDQDGDKSGGGHTKNYEFLESGGWPSVASFKGRVQVDPTQLHPVAQSNQKAPRTPNSRPKDYRDKYVEYLSPTLDSYQDYNRLKRLPHNSLDRNRPAEAVQIWLRDSEGSHTEVAAHGNSADAKHSRFPKEQIHDELDQSDPLVSHGLVQEESWIVSALKRQADPSRINPSKTAHSASSILRKSNPVLLQDIIDGQLKNTDHFAKLSQLVYNAVKAKRAKSMVAAPCQSAAAWFPNVLKRLEREMSGLQFYCIDTDSSGIESENLKKAFNGISSLRFGGFLLASPEDIEAVMPRNMDMAITWLETQEWGIRRALRFLTGLRRSGVRTILLISMCGSVVAEHEGSETSSESSATSVRKVSVTEEKRHECNRLVVYSPNG